MTPENATTTEGDDLSSQFDHVRANLDCFFLVGCGTFVLLMQMGFTFLRSRSVLQSRNSADVITKAVIDLFVTACMFYLVGHPAAFGETSNDGFISSGPYLYKPVLRGNFTNATRNAMENKTLKTFAATWFYRFVVAVTTSNIMSGCMAERATFKAIVLNCVIMTALIYPAVAHWCWNAKGWLKTAAGQTFNGVSPAFQDYAGSGVVHVTGGTAALLGSSFLRKGSEFKEEHARLLKLFPEKAITTSQGCFSLLAGFVAFNCGARLHISQQGDGVVVAMAAMNTMLCGATAALTVIVLDRTRFCCRPIPRERSFAACITAVNGGLCGMVASCAGCNDMEPWFVGVIGWLAGLTFILLRKLVAHLQLKDRFDTVAVHLGGGMVGVIFTPVFAIDGTVTASTGQPLGGVIYSGDPRALLGVALNIVGLLAIIGWSATLVGCICWFLKFFGMLRNDGLTRTADGSDLQLDDLQFSLLNSSGKSDPFSGSTVSSILKNPLSRRDSDSFRTQQKQGTLTPEELEEQCCDSSTSVHQHWLDVDEGSPAL